MAALDRLARALAGAAPLEPLPSPPEGRNLSPPWDTPKPVRAPLRPPLVTATPIRPPRQPPPSHARLLTAAGETRSIRAWAMQRGIDRRTLAYRLNHGWLVDEALGFTPRHRDHAAEQAPGAESTAKVLIVDGDGKPIPRRQVAALLGIKTTSLTHRLRQYRHPDGSTARVTLASLLAR